MKINGDFVLKNISNEYILVPVANNTLNFNCMITLNEISAFIWKCLENEDTKDEILSKILLEYKVDKDIAQNDLDEFLDRLKGEKLIEY